jgi:hypothetical protein
MNWQAAVATASGRVSLSARRTVGVARSSYASSASPLTAPGAASSPRRVPRRRTATRIAAMRVLGVPLLVSSRTCGRGLRWVTACHGTCRLVWAACGWRGMGLAGSGGPGEGAGWRVFVSHTSELRDYPPGNSYVAAAERAVSAAGHVIVDMADFPAADQPPAQLCLDRVRGLPGVCGAAGHPVRFPGAGRTGGVVHGAGVRYRDQCGPGAAGVLAGYGGC